MTILEAVVFSPAFIIPVLLVFLLILMLIVKLIIRYKVSKAENLADRDDQIKRDKEPYELYIIDNEEEN